MLTYLSGKLIIKNPTYAIVDHHGMGYMLKISLFTYEAIKDLSEVKLFTSLVVKNENQSVAGFDLYGFYTEIERDLFEKMISVSGVGAATTRMMLSSFKPEEIQQAIVSENESLIQSVKGIGPKMAKRIILELKDKMVKFQSNLPETATKGTMFDNKAKEEALYALIALGFQKANIDKVLAKLLVQNPESRVEQLIKDALKVL